MFRCYFENFLRLQMSIGEVGSSLKKILNKRFLLMKIYKNQLLIFLPSSIQQCVSNLFLVFRINLFF